MSDFNDFLKCEITHDNGMQFGATELLKIARENDFTINVRQANQIIDQIRKWSERDKFVTSITLNLSQMVGTKDITVFVEFNADNTLLTTWLRYSLGAQGKPFRYTKNFNKNYNITLIPVSWMLSY